MRDTKYTCDGCGTESPDAMYWSHPLLSNYGQKDLCQFCTSRIANSLYDVNASAVSLEIEQLKAELASAEARFKNLMADGLTETRRAEAAEVEVGRANEENARLYKSLEEAREANEAMLRRAETAEERETELEQDLRDARADGAYDTEVNRALVLELLNMLGKKAQRRNKKRLREIRLAVAADLGDDEVTW